MNLCRGELMLLTLGCLDCCGCFVVGRVKSCPRSLLDCSFISKLNRVVNGVYKCGWWCTLQLNMLAVSGSQNLCLLQNLLRTTKVSPTWSLGVESQGIRNARNALGMYFAYQRRHNMVSWTLSASEKLILLYLSFQHPLCNHNVGCWTHNLAWLVALGFKAGNLQLSCPPLYQQSKHGRSCS